MNTIFDDILPSGPPGKILSSLILLLCIVLAVSLLKRYLTGYIKDRDVRYYARKYISFFGYTVGFLILASLFSDRLGRLTVIFGIAGAGGCLCIAGGDRKHSRMDCGCIQQFL